MLEPAMPMNTYGAAPASCAEECEEMCKGKTADELSQIGDYFSKKASDLRNELTKNVTMEDYEGMIKGKEEEPEEENE